jgi:hypothetical protein
MEAFSQTAVGCFDVPVVGLGWYPEQQVMIERHEYKGPLSDSIHGATMSGPSGTSGSRELIDQLKPLI